MPDLERFVSQSTAFESTQPGLVADTAPCIYMSIKPTHMHGFNRTTDNH